MKKTEQKVIGFINRYKLVEQGEKLLIALSGGPDSVFALHFFHKYLKKYRIELLAVHFNHNLRGKESNQDEKFCEKLCEKLNIPFYSVQLDVKTFAKQNKLSIEEAARKLRYANLYEIGKDFDCDKIVTAHNQSDNTETVLLNFFSGTGYSGFSGIPVQRENIIRPLLCLTKQEIVEYLDSQKIRYRIDSSNLINDYKRNFLRNKIIPQLKGKLNPSLDEAIFRSSKSLESVSIYLDSLINKVSKKYSSFENNILRIKSSINVSNEEWIIGELLKRLLRDKFSHDFDYNDYVKIKSLFENQKGKTVQLSSKLSATREKDSIVIKNPEQDENVEYALKAGDTLKVGKITFGVSAAAKKDVKFDGKGKSEFISGDKLDDIFILRRWKSGDKFFPLGMKSQRKISDFLTDSKIETSERKKWFILENRNNIVWITGLRIDNRYRITSKTKKIYKLWMK